MPEPVDDADLHRILQAGRMAGSAKKQQVNRLVVVTGEAERARLAQCGKFSSWITTAPVVIVVVVPAGGGRPFDFGRMAQNMMVMADSLGLASCPMTFHDEDGAGEVLGLPTTSPPPWGSPSAGRDHLTPAEPRPSASPSRNSCSGADGRTEAGTSWHRLRRRSAEQQLTKWEAV